MQTKDRYKVGTLIKDMDKIGVIYRVIEAGTLQTTSAMMNWRINYEIYYFDGNVSIMGHDTIERLVISGKVKFIEPEKYDDLFQ